MTLIFENVTCFNGIITIPIFREFFDQYEKNENAYYWSKSHVLNILLTRAEFIDESYNIEGYLEKAKSLLKESDIYIEFLNSDEEVNRNYSKYIITSRMPIGSDYIYQFRIYIKFKDEVFSLIFTCLERYREKWENVMFGISKLIEVNDKDM